MPELDNILSRAFGMRVEICQVFLRKVSDFVKWNWKPL